MSSRRKRLPGAYPESLLMFVNPVGAALLPVRGVGQSPPADREPPEGKGLGRARWRAPGRINIVCLLPAQGCSPGTRCQGAVAPRWKAPAFSWNREQSPLSAPPGKGPRAGTQCPGKGADGITGGCLCSCCGSPRIACAGQWDGDKAQGQGHPQGSLPPPHPAPRQWCQGGSASAGGARVSQHRLGVGAVLSGAAVPGLQRNPWRPPARPGVIHQECERNSTAVGVPGSEWALGGGTIPLLHSSLADGAAELQLSSTEADEPPSPARSTGISPEKSSPHKNKTLCTSDQLENWDQGSLQPFPSLSGPMRLPDDDPPEVQPGAGVFRREVSLLLEKFLY